jgi:hypothetical protein
MLKALQDAQRVLSAYAEPSKHDLEATINELLRILNDRHLVVAQRSLRQGSKPEGGDA